MTQTIRITALPDDEAHPDLVAAAIETSLARMDGATLLACWTDVAVGLGEADLAIRVAVSLERSGSFDAFERVISAELQRRRLRCTVAAERLEPDIGSDNEPILQTVRDDVRRLVHLVPRGRVTTVEAIGTWIETGADPVAAALEELAATSRNALPWHRVTAADGWLDTRYGTTRSRAQAARLEADGVPVRHERVVGFRARFVEVVRLGTR